MYSFIELSNYKKEVDIIYWISGFTRGGIFVQHENSLSCNLIPFEELLFNRTLKIIGNQTWTNNLEVYMDYIRYLIQFYKTFNTINETYSVAANIGKQGDCEFLMKTLHKIYQCIKDQEMNYPLGVLSNA